MNPLVAALSRGKDGGGEDYGGDLHTRKSTHLSIPTEAAEFHFSSGELNIPVQANLTYVVCFPVICSSSDSHDVRFKQIGRPYVDDKPVFKSGDTDPSHEGTGDSADAPIVRLQSENVPG
jgi:hypothetical protein